MNKVFKEAWNKYRDNFCRKIHHLDDEYRLIQLLFDFVINPQFMKEYKDFFTIDNLTICSSNNRMGYKMFVIPLNSNGAFTFDYYWGYFEKNYNLDEMTPEQLLEYSFKILHTIKPLKI